MTSFWILLLAIWPTQPNSGESLMVRVQTEQPPQGQWMVSVRNSSGKPLKELVIPVASSKKEQVLNLGIWKEGSYTLALYLDKNKNNRLDKGLFGQPLEPYAFSNNARASFSEPSVEDQRFEHPGTTQVVRVR
jgi:uncharacterized protein (DUF2141 family)